MGFIEPEQSTQSVSNQLHDEMAMLNVMSPIATCGAAIMFGPFAALGVGLMYGLAKIGVSDEIRNNAR